MTISKNSVSLTAASPSDTVTVSNATGTVSASSTNPSVVTVSISGNTITITGVATGSATINVSVAESTNYNAASNNKSISVAVQFKPALVSWSTGTDEQIKAMVDAYYDGVLTLNEIKSVWSIGDERTVSLSAMTGTLNPEAHDAQNVGMVIMNWGGKTLSNNKTCLAIVGQKNNLLEKGYMNSTDGNGGGWDQSSRRYWCNNTYKDAFPSSFVSIFKEHKNITSGGYRYHSTSITSNDYFALASEKEVYGTTKVSNASVEASNTQFKYYETEANRVKKLGNTNSNI